MIQRLFCEAHGRKNRIKMVDPEVIETGYTIKFCVKLGYISQLKCLVCYKKRGYFRNVKIQCLSGTHGLSKDTRASYMALGADEGR